MATDYTKGDGTTIRPPHLQLQIGRGGWLLSDLSAPSIAKDADRFEQEFRLPISRRAHMLHLVVGNFSAGANWSRAWAVVDLSGAGRHSAGLDGT